MLSHQNCDIELELEVSHNLPRIIDKELREFLLPLQLWCQEEGGVAVQEQQLERQVRAEEAAVPSGSDGVPVARRHRIESRRGRVEERFLRPATLGSTADGQKLDGL